MLQRDLAFRTRYAYNFSSHHREEANLSWCPNVTGSRMRIVRITCSVMLIFLSSLAHSFSLFPHAPAAADPTHLYVWPLTDCPSQQVNVAPLVAAVLMVLGADAISGLVNLATEPLAAGAAADKNGYQAAGTNSRYFYRALVDKKNSGKYIVEQPTCYVVAYTRPDPRATPWCDDAKFAASVPETCSNGKDTLSLLAKYQDLDDPKSKIMEPLAVPKFYAEIALVDSGYSASDKSFKIVLPRYASMYYPQSLLGGWFEKNKPRHTTLQLTFSSLTNATDPFKASTVNLDLFGFIPGDKIPAETLLNNTQSNWAVVPSIPLPASYTNTTDAPFLPVTIQASLHEVGDEDVFLQAFANAFASSSSNSALGSALSTAILPGSPAALQNTAAFQTAESKYFSSMSTYQTACTAYAKAQSDSDKKSALSAAQAAYYGVQGSYTAVKAAAASSESTIPGEISSISKPCY